MEEKRNFTDFKKKLDEIASESLQTYYAKEIKRAGERKTPEEIEDIIIKGSEPELRVLSRGYWDFSG